MESAGFPGPVVWGMSWYGGLPADGSALLDDSVDPNERSWAAALVTSIDMKWQANCVASVSGVCGARSKHGTLPQSMLMAANLSTHTGLVEALAATGKLQSLSSLAYEDADRAATTLEQLARDLGHPVKIGHARRLVAALSKLHRLRHGLPLTDNNAQVARLFRAHASLRDHLARSAAARQRQS